MKKRIISCILVTVILIAASAVPSFAEGGLYGAVSILSESPRAGASADETLDMRIVRGGEYYSIVYEQVNGFKTGWKNVSGTLVFGETYTYTVLLRNDDPYSPYDYEIFLINDQTPYDWYSFEYRGHCYLALFCRFTVAAGRPTFYADGWFYQENNAKDGVAVIASDDANSAVIAVPETLDGKVVTGIGAAFRMCFSVKEVRIPSTVRSIASGAFFNYGDQLAAVTADENNPHFASVDGILYDKEITTLIAVPCGKGGEIIIPEGVASLDPDSFLYNKHITSLSFPSTLSEIPDYTLIFMDAVTTVTLSAGITRIGTGAFWGCESITDVYFHGTRAEWNKILIEAGNDYLRKAELHCDNPFVDVPAGEWYTAAAIYCAAHGYINPSASNRFMPMASVDRRAFISILARIDGADISQYEPGSFGDLGKNDSCAKAAEWAYQNGYTAGVGAGMDGKPRFGASIKLSREQIAQFLYNYAKRNGRDLTADGDLSRFTDGEDVSKWAVRAMRWAVDAEIFSGTDTGALIPKETCKRAEVAVIIMRFMENVMG